MPTYRPVSRNSTRTSSPFDPPNIPLITPPILTPSGTGETLHDNDPPNLLEMGVPLPDSQATNLRFASTSDVSCKAEDQAPFV
ncbi:hypothetical protein FHG87_024997, partial [Trinorchestia longiramus]